MIFDDPEDFTRYIDNIIKGQNEFFEISVYGLYDQIKPVFECAIRFGYEIREIVDLCYGDFDDYYKEFVLYISKHGVSVEKEVYGGDYIYGCAHLSFVHGACNSKVLDYIESESVFELVYQDEYVNDVLTQHI